MMPHLSVKVVTVSDMNAVANIFTELIRALQDYIGRDRDQYPNERCRKDTPGRFVTKNFNKCRDS